MNKKVVRIIIGVVALVIVVVAIFSGNKEFEGPHTEYKCDVKSLNFATTIEIEKGEESFAKVKGNIFTFVTDPLTMYDLNGGKIAYAGDAYHFFAQDSHTIYVDGVFTAEMVGLVSFFGESYDIYDANQTKIATVKFNEANTSGEMYDVANNLIADYTSNLLFNDFTVRISENCNLNERAVLMIFCSYYSDQAYDAEATASSNSSKKSD